MEKTTQVGRPKLASTKESIVFSVSEEVFQMYRELKDKGVKMGRTIDSDIRCLNAGDIARHNIQRRSGAKKHIGIRISPESKSIIRHFKDIINFSSVAEESIERKYYERA